MNAPEMFYIRSAMNAKVVEVSNDGNGDTLQMAMKKPGQRQNQLWYIDRNGILRSSIKSLAMDATSGRFRVSAYDISNPRQQWSVSSDKVVNKLNPNECLDIRHQSNSDGAALVPYTYKGQNNQLWVFDYLLVETGLQTRTKAVERYFVIRSHQNGKVLDVCGGLGNPGDAVVMYPRHQKDQSNQLWYEDEDGLLRSKQNHLILDATSGKFTVNKYDPSNPRQKWKLVEKKICNATNLNEVLDIKGASNSNGAEVLPYTFKNSLNQLWDIDYV